MAGQSLPRDVAETAIKINEKLKKRGKTLDNISQQEFSDIGKEIGLKPLVERKEMRDERKDEN